MWSSIRRTVILTAAGLLTAAVLLAQDPAFEVASVKRNVSGPQGAGGGILPNGVNIVNLPLRAIIQLAYGIGQPSKVINAPNWIVTERYDITARASDRVKQGEIGRMLQALLKDRFSLVTHKETREVTAYVLTMARPDGKPGPQLHVSTAECADLADGTAPKDAVRCGPRPGGPGKLILVGSPISLAVNLLSLMLQRPVVDKTGLTGKYDLEVSFAPLLNNPAGFGAEAAPQAADPAGPSIFTAFQEQLGIKIDSSKTQEEVLVIDHVERPTEN
jgi:uncharacterized protein (TIGR03435 family)